MLRPSPKTYSLIVASACLLLSCGGGGGDTPLVTNPPLATTSGPAAGAPAVANAPGAAISSSPAPNSSATPATSAPSATSVTPAPSAAPTPVPAPTTVTTPTPIPTPSPVPPPVSTGSYNFANWGLPFSGTIVAPAETAYQCKNSTSVQEVGPFKLYGNDCVVSYQVSEASFQEYLAGTLDVGPILQQFSARFKDEVDTVVLLADSGLNRPADISPLYGRYTSVDTRTTGRARRMLGYLEFPFALTAVTNGPFLHEFVHEFANRGVLPNETDSGHWGFASVGGQLGGFDLSTLTQPDSTRSEFYKAGVRRCTPLANAPQNWLDYCNQQKAFGTFANGGNTVPYAALELWAMGLLPDAQLSTIQVAKIPIEVDPVIGTFIVFGWDYFTAANIRARLGRFAPNTATAQNKYRAATLVLTTKQVVDQSTLDRVATDLNIMQTRDVSTAMLGCSGFCLNYHNFYTATRSQASIAFGDLTSLKRAAPF
jgi:hypothetical protein